AGLVARRRPVGDGRSVVVEATSTGREVLAAGRRARLALLEKGLAELSKEDRAALAHGVGALERLLASTPC
ncbi:MAG: MarR family transcriptional regulator, partial [Micromonosporaceae bacterium]|nr:MarR family transcriptional regulator [Micromonosporaceae bacterium]